MATKFVKLDVVTLTSLPQYLSEGNTRTSCAGVYAAILLCEIESMMQSASLGIKDSAGDVWVWNSHERWAIETGLTKQQVRTALEALVKGGILIAKPLRAQKGDMTMFYTTNSESEYWTYWGAAEGDYCKARSEEQNKNALVLEHKPSALELIPSALQRTCTNDPKTSSKTSSKKNIAPQAEQPAELPLLQKLREIRQKYITETGRQKQFGSLKDNDKAECDVLRLLMSKDGYTEADIIATAKHLWNPTRPADSFDSPVVYGSIKNWRNSMKDGRMKFTGAFTDYSRSLQPAASNGRRDEPRTPFSEGFDYTEGWFKPGVPAE